MPLCATPRAKNWKTPDVQTADFAYLAFASREYSPKERKALEQRIARLGAGGDIYIYFKHEDTPEGALARGKRAISS